MKLKTKQIVILSMFIALSFVGSYLKIPSPFGTVALDAAPAFLAALILGPIPGAVVAFLGHILTSVNVGMPLSFPIHLLIAIEMAFICLVVGAIYRKGLLILALIIGIVLNGVVAPAFFILIPQFGLPFFTVMLVPLLVGATVNALIAGLLAKTLKGRIMYENK